MGLFSFRFSLFGASFFLLLFFSFLFRILHLDSMPGFNGDEAWHAFQAQQFLSGETVQWIAPTGRLSSPIYFLSCVLLDLLLPKAWISLVALRMTSVLSGIALVLLAFFLVKRLYGIRVAVVTGMLLACLPVNIAYARVALESSQIALGSLGVVYFLLKQRWGWLIAACALAVLMHPIHIFLLPLVVVYALYCVFSDRTRDEDQRYRRGMVVLAVAVCFVVGVVFSVPKRFTSPELIWAIFDFDGLLPFFENYLRVFSGVQAYREFVHEVNLFPAAIYDSLTFLLIGGLGTAALWKAYQRKRWELIAFSCGVFLSLMALWLVGGLPTVGEIQRYSLFSIVPMCVLLGRWVGELSETSREGKIAFVGVSAYSWLLIAGFAQFYFGAFRETAGGGTNTEVYRSAASEPKTAALDWVFNEMHRMKVQDPPVPTLLLAEGWNTYWPGRYLSKKKRVPVVAWLKDIRRWKDWELLRQYQIYVVAQEGGFSQSVLDLVLKQKVKPAQTFFDFQGKPYARVWVIPRAPQHLAKEPIGFPVNMAPSSANRLFESKGPERRLFNNIGLHYLMAKDFPKAVEAFSLGVEANRLSGPLHGNLAIALSKVGNHEKAVVHMLNALTLEPTLYSSFTSLMALETRHKVVSKYAKQEARARDLSNVLKRTGNALFSTRKYEEAAKVFESSLRWAKKDTIILNNLGATYLKLGKAKKAQAQFKAALAISPQDRQTQANLAAAFKFDDGRTVQ